MALIQPEGNRLYSLVYRKMFEERRLAQVDIGARWVFVSLLTWCDNRGYVSADPDLVQHRAFPYEPDWAEPGRIDRLLDQLHNNGLVYVYSRGGGRHALIPHFNKYNPLRGNMKQASDAARPPDRAACLAWAAKHGKDLDIVASALDAPTTVSLRVAVQTRSNAFEHVQTRSTEKRIEEKRREEDAPQAAKHIGSASDRANEDIQEGPDPYLTGDADVDAVSIEFTRRSGSVIGATGVGQIRYWLEEKGVPVARLVEATREIVWKAKEPPKYFSYVNRSLAEWLDEHPPSHRTEAEAAQRNVEARREARTLERDAWTRAADVLASMPEEDRATLRAVAVDKLVASMPSFRDDGSYAARKTIEESMVAMCRTPPDEDPHA